MVLRNAIDEVGWAAGLPFGSMVTSCRARIWFLCFSLLGYRRRLGDREVLLAAGSEPSGLALRSAVLLGQGQARPRSRVWGLWVHVEVTALGEEVIA